MPAQGFGQRQSGKVATGYDLTQRSPRIPSLIFASCLPWSYCSKPSLWAGAWFACLSGCRFFPCPLLFGSCPIYKSSLRSGPPLAHLMPLLNYKTLSCLSQISFYDCTSWGALMRQQCWLCTHHSHAHIHPCNASVYTINNAHILNIPTIPFPVPFEGWKLGSETSGQVRAGQGCYVHVYMYVKVLVIQLCLTLCDPMDCSPWNAPGKNTGAGSHSLLQGIFLPRDRTRISHIADRFFTL